MRREVPTIRPIVPTPRGDAAWFAQSVEYYADNDAAQSGTIGSGQETWMQTTVIGPGNVSFRYKMSSVSGDALAFYVDESFKASWSQGSSWPWTGNFAVPSGTHTLKWKYYKYSGSTAGSAWVDAIQWSGGVPGSGGGADWQQITYTYDPSGRRIAKDVDGVVTKYRAACPELAERDGDQCIAEYDGDDTLLRKYIHGRYIDEPICMIEAAGGYAGTYYYHFDALGSVVALSDADGDTVQVYEYDVYGQVAASDPNHPNRFLFTGREFDTETGLYYYRARYYNASIGRFLQTDPIGYDDGINVYCYCRNSPISWIDPLGLKRVAFYDGSDPGEGFFAQNGNMFHESADDDYFDYSFDMRPPEEVQEWLKANGLPEMTCLQYVACKLLELQNAGIEVTEVFFFDHGLETGLEFGDDFYERDGSGDLSLQHAAEMLGAATEEGTTLHFRNCYAGCLVKDIAMWSGRRATGFECELVNKYDDIPYWEYDEGYERKGPEYEPRYEGQYVKATPVIEDGRVVDVRIETPNYPPKGY